MLVKTSHRSRLGSREEETQGINQEAWFIGVIDHHNACSLGGTANIIGGTDLEM
jgi:hypothetical protein